ncbi:hypothetical protein FRB94_008927 [Tulasnella sp. JGI-2019a]|nr:hypothetical protein FRB93_008197 [Tulasnella sp. JGI-2019a]KAG8995561.1 hypothetical protein FRB94_008927 [Tulasnella sp. JGI-2019a]
MSFMDRYEGGEFDSEPSDTKSDDSFESSHGSSKDDAPFNPRERKGRDDNSNSGFNHPEKHKAMSHRPEPKVGANEDDSVRHWEANSHREAGEESRGRVQGGKLQGNIRELGHSNPERKGRSEKSDDLPFTTDEENEENDLD